jgi:hypothetical protein
LRGAGMIEQWYRQPPSPIRTYEWAPLIAVVIALLVANNRGTLRAHWLGIIILPAVYYIYILIDLALIKPARMAKWVRNSMPIWLILLWHNPLTKALAVPSGEKNSWLVAAILVAFFPFFYEDYFSLQKFVRGIVASYYYSLALQLGWPHPLGVMVAMLGFIAIFVFWYRVIYRWWIAAAMCAVMAAAILSSASSKPSLLIYAGLGLAVNLYLQTFISIAYDIRRAGNVSLK